MANLDNLVAPAPCTARVSQVHSPGYHPHRGLVRIMHAWSGWGWEEAGACWGVLGGCKPGGRCVVLNSLHPMGSPVLTIDQHHLLQPTSSLPRIVPSRWAVGAGQGMKQHNPSVVSCHGQEAPACNHLIFSSALLVLCHTRLRRT